MKIQMNKFLAFIFILITNACAVGDAGSGKSGDQPGLCKLNCNKTLIAPSDSNFRARALFTTITQSCPTENEPKTFNLKWVFEQNVKKKTDDPDNYQGVPYVSFDVSGVPKNSEGEGMVTSIDNRCSDACGVATIEFTAKCPLKGQTSTLSILVSSGGLAPEQPTTVTLTGPN